MTLGENLLRYNKNQEYALFDDETEGLNRIRSRPWQKAWVIADQNGIKVEQDRFLWYPDLKISPAAAKITKFNYDNYKAKAEDPKKVFEDFDKVLWDTRYIKAGHNILGYDIDIYNVLRRHLGLKPTYQFLYQKDNLFIDTNILAKAYKKNIPVPSIYSKEYLPFCFRLLSLREKGLKTNLTSMGKEFKIEVDYDSLHDGLNDLKLNWPVLQQLLWKVEI